MTVKELIDKLNKVEDKTKIVKVFESDFISDDISNSGTIREVSYSNNPVDDLKTVRIYTFA